MAIRVKTGIVEQQKADASVFGYNQVYQSSASAVANALDKTAQAAGNIANVFQKKQAVANKIVADQANVTYTNGLVAAQSQLKDAYASGNAERIEEAKQNYNTYDPNAQGFSFAAYQAEGSNVSDNTYYTKNGYLNNAQQLWGKAENATRNYEPQYQITRTLNSQQDAASESLHRASQQYLGQTMPQMAYENVLGGIIAFGNNEGFGALSSEQARNAGLAQASNLTRQLLEQNIRNARSEDEINWFLDSVIDRYDDQLKFVTEGDREKILDAAKNRVGQLTANDAKLLKDNNQAALDQTSQTFFNTLGQASDIESLVAAATDTHNALKNVDPTYLSDSDREKYNSASAIALFFQPQQVENAAGEVSVTSPFRYGLLTALAKAKQNGDLPKYVLDNELLPHVRPDDAGKLRQYVDTVALNIHKGLQEGDTSVLAVLTPNPAEQAQLLQDLGYRDMPLFTGNNTPWSANDVESSASHIAQALTDNTPAAVAQRGFNLVRGADSTKSDRAVGLNYMLAASASNPEEAAKITKVISELTAASDRYVNAQHTPLVQMFLGGEAGQVPETTEMTDSEVYNMYKVALQNGDTQEAEAYLSLFQGLIVSVSDGFADVLYDVEKGGVLGAVDRALSTETAVNVLAGKDLATRARMLNTFFDKERELLTQRTGLTRVAYNDTKVAILPSMLDSVDLEYRKPMNPVWESLLSRELPFTNANVVFGISPRVASFLNRATYYDRQALSARFRNGDYSVLPEQATNRVAEIYTKEVAQAFDLNFTPEMVKNVDKFPVGFRQMVEEFGFATTRTRDDLESILMDASVVVGGTVYPLLDFSSKSWANNEIGVAVRYYDRTTGRYENLIDTNNEQVVITASAAMNRLNSEGGWVPHIGATSRERVLSEIEMRRSRPRKPETTGTLFGSEYFGE